ncbi:hypothetical protein PLESTB_001360600 [Pleodorina starrii]|uniref:Uncharacterized protein n=1 Tax=Pleodorina starrii TaxID=330485 RepID=A0A9W6F6T6_9CHLO|nr:hypothetical protein PLESTM_002067000 [Pleodorina starrii]GLC58453.1 hypothetical protein PLESTB_001360600 [Pleodorina starrii]GLC77441.1 hypothetical protein PLESTF_001936400 [Pleodorina starrii]
MSLATGHGMQWCGTLSDAGLLGPLFSPCTFETLSSTLLLATSLIVLLAQGTRLAAIQQLRVHGRLRKGISGLNGSYIAAALFLCGTHAIHFAVGLVLLRAWPFHIVYHACLSLVWGTIAAFAIYTGRLMVSVDFRIATIPTTLVYCISLYSHFRLYFDTHGIPLPYIKASIWTDMLQVVVAAVISWLGFARAARGPSPAALQAQLGFLLGGGGAAGPDGLGAYQHLPEAEAAGGSAAGGSGKPPPGGAASTGDGDDADKTTWISLFVEACAYVWPESFWLQARAVACLLLLVAMRFLNLAVPILYKKVVDRLAAGSGAGGGGVSQQPDANRGLGLDLGLGRLLAGAGAGWWPGPALESGSAPGPSGSDPEGLSFGALVWPWVVLYLAAVFFQGGAGGGVVGFINNIRSYLWIPVSQDSYRRISLRTFDHVLGLDLTFHLRKKTGEVTKVVDRGTNAMQNLLATVLFNILPQMFDVLAAATYLAQALEPTIAIIVFVTVGSYIPLTVFITEWRGKLRREMNQTDQVKSGRATDALLNYETVKYFSNERHESQQYAAAIDAYQLAEFKSMSSINLLNVVQSAIMFCGIASGLLVCAGGVSAHVLTVGDTVLFLSLMAQLYGPLNFFGSYYRTIQQYMIDMENLLELLGRRSVVEDSPAARELVMNKGELSFDDVCFQYEPGSQVLRNVSFRVPGGRTIAFVGATGSGKSTITRLIFRFYDVSSGAVRIDGQDVREVTQSSLRRAVGMVPQDTVLFNDTILHNIRYGNLSATDEQVYEAAKLACIHDTIVNRFPKKYETVVGERGLRLSGGEKQRVAFARALLKNPTMLVLDEATSALDTITEKKIQSALSDLRSERTTVIVAHRLSTIADADIIVVMATGRVVELGGHAELLERGGLYAEMWARQAASAAQGGEGSAGPSLQGSTVDLTVLNNGSPAAAAKVAATDNSDEGSGGTSGVKGTSGPGASAAGPATAVAPAPSPAMVQRDDTLLLLATSAPEAGLVAATTAEAEAETAEAAGAGGTSTLDPATSVSDTIAAAAAVGVRAPSAGLSAGGRGGGSGSGGGGVPGRGKSRKGRR